MKENTVGNKSSENNVDKRLENGLNSKYEVQRNKYAAPSENNVRNTKVSPICEKDRQIIMTDFACK